MSRLTGTSGLVESGSTGVRAITVMTSAVAMISQRLSKPNCSSDFIKELKKKKKKPTEVPAYHAQSRFIGGRKGEPFSALQAIPIAAIAIDNPIVNKRWLCVTEYM